MHGTEPSPRTVSPPALSPAALSPSVSDAIPPALRRRGVRLRQVFPLVLIAAAVLAPLASTDTPGWAEQLGDSPVAHRVRDIVGTWDRAMAALGLNRPHEALRAAMQRFLDRQWGG